MADSKDVVDAAKSNWHMDVTLAKIKPAEMDFTASVRNAEIGKKMRLGKND